jgi:phosphate transport system protein
MDIGLERLTNMLIEMADLSQKSVSRSIEAYREGKNLLEEIYEWSNRLRELEDDVGEIATEMIARYQPVASDLRFIRACMEISYGFARFGRYAYDIAEVLQMFGDLSDCDHKLVIDTAVTAIEMMKMSIDAFVKRDIVLAREVKEIDDIVDNNYRNFISRMVKNSNDANLKCTLSTTLILRYLERIADHSYSIGDSVVYIEKGERPKNTRKATSKKLTT